MTSGIKRREVNGHPGIRGHRSVVLSNLDFLSVLELFGYCNLSDLLAGNFFHVDV